MNALDTTRIFVAAGVLVSLWTVESLAPMYRGRRHRLRHAGINFGLAAANLVVGLVFASALAASAALAEREQFGLVRALPLPPGFDIVCALLLFDVWQYAWHRLNHRIPLLWHFHALHHADAELDVTSGVRFHPMEIALSSVARLVVVPLIGLNLETLVLYEALALPVILFHHSNIHIGRRADTALRWLVVTPWMHWVHHSRWPPETDSNFASLLSVWDRIFGTFRLRRDPEAIRLGLDEY